MTAFDSYSSDDEEDKCPLCIEDMDITDKNFKPCPCGFQICQFCFNNIRSGPAQYNRCPACRRPYDDESIEYKTLTPEEMKQEQERKQRKEQMRKQREREKNKEMHHHFDQRDKKHLANVRVIQKNLVYVIGLNPNIPSEDLQQMLRRDEYFGQYGKIQKIVVNKRVNGNGNLGVGVYVTFARKEDAARCIAAVDGSINDGKYLRAAYGTTKYCSSYLRGQNCPNQNCMFLHEPGEEADSFNRHHPNHQGGLASSSQPSSGAHLPLSSQGSSGMGTSGSQFTGNYSASASPASVHSTLSTHSGAPANLGGAGATGGLGSLSSGAAGTGSNAGHPLVTPSLPTPAAAAAAAANSQATALNGTAAPPGLSTAATPALPAWGKVAPQIPPVHKIVGTDLPDPACDSLRLLETNLASLSTESWDLEFVSEILNADTKFPAMFSLPLDEKRRLKSYNKAIEDLDQMLKSATMSEPQRKQSSETVAADHHYHHSNLNDLSAGSTVSPSPSDTTPKAEAKKNNSQHLLAHLMRGVSPSPAQQNRQDEDQLSSNASPALSSSPKENATESVSESPPLDRAAALNAIDKSNAAKSENAYLKVLEKLRHIGGDILQPAPPVTPDELKEFEIPKSALEDDGPSFDLRDIPHVEIAGDVKPSVWSAIEELTWERKALAQREKEFAAAKSQTKKRAKRLRA